jgi:diguanylate cyclase (GGDEF)-like protein
LGTPCQGVISSDDIVLYRNVQQRFADEKMLINMNIEDYIGLKFYIAGHAVGHIFLMSIQITNPPALRLTKLLLKILAMYIGAHIDLDQKKLTINSLTKKAYSDAVTGLGNRHAFDHDMHRILHQVQVGMLSDALLILLDIDGLKRINDLQGHAAGDELISLMSRILKKDSRKEDLVYRLGGDEFALLITGNAREVYQGIERRLSHWRFQLQTSVFPHSGVSMGATLLSELRPNSLKNNKLAWFEYTDQRLYIDKENKYTRLALQ